MKKIKATFNDQGRTLFKFLIKYLNNVPLSKIEKLFRLKDVKINGKRTNDKKYKIKENDLIEIYGIDNQLMNSSFINENSYSNIIRNFEIIYEDKNILIINKDEKTAIHSEENSLDFQVLKYLKFKQIDSFIPSHIGRIDKNTSGIVVYAKNYNSLVQLKEKQSFFEKIYIFKSDIIINEKTKTSFYLEKDDKKRKMKVVEKSKDLAITEFFMENNKKLAKLITGKKHQIRVTLSKMGFPIYGDKKYGGKKDFRLFLHSYRIKFNNLTDELDYLNNKEFICFPKW
ncbi:RluA family pseudouridine synthase [Mesomycoplasma molare]|uniref:RNA pseudouridylate synthase n=1 Tax=Mesomycoplasma molare TaxID=171288 RepID=A0ABY5TU04_9BACT|nr:RluA family pseudouridine synthase [Mesomycoplasma molare]UWD34142.1 RluA family pseudouridine synthase [Mesomycoplasma molare]